MAATIELNAGRRRKRWPRRLFDQCSALRLSVIIGSIRRECVDHIIVLGEVHLRQILQAYAAITTTSGRTGHWTKMHQSLVKFSESEASNHRPSLADFTTTMPELKFSVHTTGGTPKNGSDRAFLRILTADSGRLRLPACKQFSAR